jgi:hypothetical protein
MGRGITISASKPQWSANYTSESTAPRVAKNNQHPGITAFILTYYHPLQVNVASWKFHSGNSMPLNESSEIHLPPHMLNRLFEFITGLHGRD